MDGLGFLRVGGAAGNVARGAGSGAGTPAAPRPPVVNDPGGVPYSRPAASEASGAPVGGLFARRGPPLLNSAEADRECFGVGFLRGGGPESAAGFLLGGGGGGASLTEEPAIARCNSTIDAVLACRAPPPSAALPRPPPPAPLPAALLAPLPALTPSPETAATLTGAVAVRRCLGLRLGRGVGVGGSAMRTLTLVWALSVYQSPCGEETERLCAAALPVAVTVLALATARSGLGARLLNAAEKNEEELAACDGWPGRMPLAPFLGGGGGTSAAAAAAAGAAAPPPWGP